MVENGGWGSDWGAPIASLMIEKYLSDSISRPQIEKRMLEGVIQPKIYMEKKEAEQKKDSTKTKTKAVIVSAAARTLKKD